MRGDHEHLQQLVADLHGNERLKRVGKVVADQLDDLADEMARLIREEIPVFGETRDRELLRTGWLHGLAHAKKISELLLGEPVGDLSFVSEHAVRRAEQRFPLNDILHTYRIGHRVMWGCMRDNAMKLAAGPEEGLLLAMTIADFTIRYTNLISVALTRAYTYREKQLNNTRVRQTRLLFDELSKGRLVTAEARELADTVGIGRWPYFVVCLQPIDGDAYSQSQRLQSVVEMLERRFENEVWDSLIEEREDHIRTLLVARGGNEGSRAGLVNHLGQIAAELDALVGISTVAFIDSDFPQAASEAMVAVAYATSGLRVVDLSAMSMHEVIIANRHLDVSRLLPEWYAKLSEMDRNSAGCLGETVTAFADNDLSVKGAAKSLGVHPNTVRFRLNKIQKITCISPKSFRGLQELVTVLALGRCTVARPATSNQRIASGMRHSGAMNFLDTNSQQHPR